MEICVFNRFSMFRRGVLQLRRRVQTAAMDQRSTSGLQSRGLPFRVFTKVCSSIRDRTVLYAYVASAPGVAVVASA
jgi:hypothetical protein